MTKHIVSKTRRGQVDPEVVRVSLIVVVLFGILVYYIIKMFVLQ